MNQEKIGKFIAQVRKENHLTQEELATMLRISKNAVSKWERGICLMDMSLLKPLSEILHVTVNDILAGEKLDKLEIEKKSEENIINLTELINLKTMRYGIIGMAICFIILIFISLFKNVSPASLVSLICVYNSVTFLSRYKIGKEKSDCIAGILFFLAAILNTISFILS